MPPMILALPSQRPQSHTWPSALLLVGPTSPSLASHRGRTWRWSLFNPGGFPSSAPFDLALRLVRLSATPPTLAPSAARAQRARVLNTALFMSPQLRSLL